METKSGLLDSVQRQIKTLHERAMNADGKIELDVHQNFTEIKANEDQLMLQFPGDHDSTKTPGRDVGFRHLYFHKGEDGSFRVALGSVVCNDNGTLYLNRVTDALTQYVDVTAPLDKITA